MKRHTVLVRYFSILWAALQLAAPGMSAVADGLLARASAAGPATHIEATTSASCPVVHSPDCAVCRFLSLSSAADAAPATLAWVASSSSRVVAEATNPHRDVDTRLPHGRAPPTA